MPTPRRSGSNRGSSQNPSGARRPRVAGHRQHTAQHSSKPAEQEPAEQEPGEPQETHPDTAAEQNAESGEQVSDTSVSATADFGKSEQTSSERGEPESALPEQDGDSAQDGGSDQSGSDSSASADGGVGNGNGEPRQESDTASQEGAAEEGTAGEGAAEEGTAGEGAAEEGTAEEGAAEEGTAEEGAAEGGAGRTGRRLPRPATVLVPLMLVLTVAFSGLAVWFQTGSYYSLRSDGATTNRALVDQAATSQVKGQITTAVEKLFSYDFNNTAKTEKAAKNLLTGKAVQKYDKLFATVRKEAPKQKLVLSTTVQAAGVTRLQENRAQVLVFANQHVTRNDNGQSNGGPAQLSVTAEKHGDQWKITGLTPR